MDVGTIGERLRDPFPLESLGWKPQAVKGNRALAVAYIDARDVMQRLDDAVGVENWQDDYVPLAGGQVMCKLSVCIGGAWVTKCDVGGESEQPDKGDREKAAFSDALKRAAVKFGIGRYLYSMPSSWCDFDPVKKQFTQTPSVPPQFLPRGKAPVRQAPPQQAPQQQSPQQQPPKPDETPKAALPANGQELHRRLQDYDAKLAAQKLCQRGALLSYVTQAGVRAGYAANMADWYGPALPFAVNAVKEFEEKARQPGGLSAAEGAGKALFENPAKKTGVPH